MKNQTPSSALRPGRPFGQALELTRNSNKSWLPPHSMGNCLRNAIPVRAYGMMGAAYYLGTDPGGRSTVIAVLETLSG